MTPELINRRNFPESLYLPDSLFRFFRVMRVEEAPLSCSVEQQRLVTEAVSNLDHDSPLLGALIDRYYPLEKRP